MKLSSISIHRPVLATVLTLILILFGILSFTHLPVREYPDIDPAIVSIRSVYPGASAQIVEGDVTTVLEESLSGLESVKAITSMSREEVSQITVEFDLGRDLDDATNDVRDRVFGVRRWLPVGIEEPIITKASSDAEAILWLSLQSDRHTDLEVTDYAERHLKDRLGTVADVSAVWVWGARRYAMRLWLDADRLAARQLAVQDVEAALLSQNVAIPSGRIESDRTEFSVRTRGELQTPEQFNRLILAYRDGYPIRLEDVGHAELGAEDDRKLVRFNGKPTLGLGIVKQSQGNTLAVARAVKDRIKTIQAVLPEGMTLGVVADSSRYIERSLHEAYVSLGVSLLLVVLVTFAFLGSVRATIIPAVTIPASIVSTFTVMHLFGFSINVLTLLGFVLAVGLVVDDAIVMLENIHRRIEAGQRTWQAALEGSREIGFAVIVTTISLVCVFVPIAFITGGIARLFSELALAVAAAVAISGFIALTLTPMMSAKLLAADAPRAREGRAAASRQIRERLGWKRRVDRFFHDRFARLTGCYRNALTYVLQSPTVLIAIGAGTMVVGVVLFMSLGAELAPQEDMGGFSVMMTAPEGSTIRYTDQYARQIEAMFPAVSEVESSWTWVATGLQPSLVSKAGSWVNLRDWGERQRTQQQIVTQVNQQLAQVSGVVATASNPPALGHAAGTASVQMVISGTSYEDLERFAGLLLDRAKTYRGLVNPQVDLNLNKPALDVHVDRNKAADLGISVSSVGRTLETLLGGRPVTSFNRGGREYPVIVKIQGQHRVTPSDIHALYVRGHDNELVQLSNLVRVQETVAPRELSHYNRMRSTTLTAEVAQGATLGAVLAFLERTAEQFRSPGTTITFSGESRDFKESTRSVYLTFFVALLIIYLVLAAEFESFIHPLTILFSVPPALTGALASLAVFGGTLNIYSEIGLIMLIGLVTKNAILIVDVATQLRGRHVAALPAVVEAAGLRLRPILMTTFATILGAVPLAFATGAGAAGRGQIGYVVIAGLCVSTLLTLFIVPALYVVLGRKQPASVRPQAQEPERWLFPVG